MQEISRLSAIAGLAGHTMGLIQGMLTMGATDEQIFDALERISIREFEQANRVPPTRDELEANVRPFLELCRGGS